MGASFLSGVAYSLVSGMPNPIQSAITTGAGFAVFNAIFFQVRGGLEGHCVKAAGTLPAARPRGRLAVVQESCGMDDYKSIGSGKQLSGNVFLSRGSEGWPRPLPHGTCTSVWTHGPHTFFHGSRI